jgi:hypothetical protein
MDGDYRSQEQFRDRSSSQDWGEEEGSQNSSCSQRSDEYHESSGTMNDLLTHQYGVCSSIRSTGSVGSQESIGQRHQRLIHVEAVRFPPSMYAYPRSDAGTVGSGTALEDIEVDSLMSQEETIHPPAGDKFGRRSSSAGSCSSARMVDFAETNEDIVVPASAAAPRAMSDTQFAMGPPLSRALLLQKAERHFNSLGSNAGSDYAGSHPPSRPSSVKSFGSNSDLHVDVDDCGGSLDVETHSVGTRSVHSHDDAPPRETEVSEAAHALEQTSLHHQQQQLMEEDNNQYTRSPGGTKRRVRYMNLPPPRNGVAGVHLDAVLEEHDEHQSKLRGRGGRPPLSGDDDRQRRPYYNPVRPRRRSRSRSRSPDMPVRGLRKNR